MYNITLHTQGCRFTTTYQAVIKRKLIQCEHNNTRSDQTRPIYWNIQMNILYSYVYIIAYSYEQLF